MKTDVLIVGTGCAGLFCALELPGNLNVTVISKSRLDKSDSYLAQGGICMLRSEEDYDSYFEDTMRAGHYENDRVSVDTMIRQSPYIIEKLVEYGVDFNREENGDFAFTREGAHSHNRILFHKDITGREIIEKLIIKAQQTENITLLDHTTMVDILTKNNTCYGAVVRYLDGKIEKIEAKATVLATGGIGGLFSLSTNYRHITGDSIAVALKHNIAVKHLDYIQIHPTTFFHGDNIERSFLISESVRGEGAKLYNSNNERFVNELLPRDKVTEAIYNEMEKTNSRHVWEDLTPIGEEELYSHFPNITKYCSEKGYDVTKEMVPVVPAQHYFMGGIDVDHKSKTSMEQLYAVGETSCNGVHGKNRLASNSLLESMVFGKIAADDIARHIENYYVLNNTDELFNAADYADLDELRNINKDMVLGAIENAKNNKGE